MWILKGFVCYICARLFYMSKREQLWNKEKCFLFHFESTFRPWDNSNFKFSDIQMLWRHQMPKHETQNIYWWTTCEVNIVCNEIWPVYVMLWNKIFYQKMIWKMLPGN